MKEICVRTMLALVFLFSLQVFSQDSEKKDDLGIKWQQGPCIGDLGKEAEIRVDAGYMYCNAEDTKKLMTAMQNLLSNEERGLVAPPSMEWFIVFEFEESGYVKDDEKSKLDADAMLKSLKAGNEAANKEKAKKGWETSELVGWVQPPRYNEETHNLEWGTKYISKDGGATVNYNTRLLGRKGVMSVTLVATPEKIDEIIPLSNKLISGFTYKSGNKYSEFVQGDKIAEYGLVALIAGGATAAAIKGGFFKFIWKFIVAIGVGIAALFNKIKAFFTRNKDQ